MHSSPTGQNSDRADLTGLQSSASASWRSSSARLGASNGTSSTDQPASADQAATNSVPASNQPPFDSMMAMLLQTQGIAGGQTGSTLSSGVSDDVQFTSDQTAGGGALKADLQSLLSILSDRNASSAANGGTGAPPAATVSTALDSLDAMLTKNSQAVANALGTNASGTASPATGTTTAPAGTAASSGSATQATLPPWAVGWFGARASTEAATTGQDDPFGQQNGMTLNHRFTQAASAYAAASGIGVSYPLTNVTA